MICLPLSVPHHAAPKAKDPKQQPKVAPIGPAPYACWLLNKGPEMPPPYKHGLSPLT